ncbi:PilZ domain-containing protein [candidate division FCPU426 bacterium]|nr:PilZ domain-containing protein [candidate division FCPU426 bacterium]
MEEASLSFDKRKHPRISLTIPVQFKVISDTEEAMAVMAERKTMEAGKSKNVSAEGLFLLCDRPLEKGDILKIEVTLPHDHKPIRAFSEVVWISEQSVAENKYGAGICFMALRDEDAERIGQFVAGLLKQKE